MNSAITYAIIVIFVGIGVVMTVLVGMATFIICAIYVCSDQGGILMFEVGDRVISNDPGLAKLRQIMIYAGYDPEPNNIGTVTEVLGDLVMVQWDGEDGQLSPHPSNLLEKLEEGE